MSERQCDRCRGSGKIAERARPEANVEPFKVEDAMDLAILDDAHRVLLSLGARAWLAGDDVRAGAAREMAVALRRVIEIEKGPRRTPPNDDPNLTFGPR